VLAVIGIQLSHLIGASFVIEKVFGMSGLGSLLIDSVTKNDFAVLQAVTLIVVLGVLLVNILLDVVHAYVDPKARLV
jgi:peptide/nickel transport system permease protein